MSQSSLAIIGSESLLERIYVQVQKNSGLLVSTTACVGKSTRLEALTKSDPKCRYFHDIDINSDEFLKSLAVNPPDYIVSAGNFQIFGKKLLAMARRTCINFHNGPLPQYRGINIPTWAIWNGEETHSICFHLMTAEIDAGVVVLEQAFELSPKETAASLSMKCLSAGLKLVPGLLDRLDSGLDLREPMAGLESKGTYYSKRQIPENGLIQARWSFEKVDRLVRALNYRGLPHSPSPARTLTSDGFRFVDQTSYWDEPTCQILKLRTVDGETIEISPEVNSDTVV